MQEPIGAFARPVSPGPAALGLSLLLCFVPALAAAAAGDAKTALYLDRTVAVSETLDADGFWVTPEDLTRVNDFVLKPEGACLDELCIPVDQSETSNIVKRQGDQTWFSLTAFADKVGQPFTLDEEESVWSFGTIPPARSAFLDNALAPDFTLPDREGNPVRLQDLRGKKVLILTWASW